eukprot:scaffold13096_cov22-Tisochrysis_lutea.AAC.1
MQGHSPKNQLDALSGQVFTSWEINQVRACEMHNPTCPNSIQQMHNMPQQMPSKPQPHSKQTKGQSGGHCREAAGCNSFF